jgi:hypothetical protein
MNGRAVGQPEVRCTKVDRRVRIEREDTETFHDRRGPLRTAECSAGQNKFGAITELISPDKPCGCAGLEPQAGNRSEGMASGAGQLQRAGRHDNTPGQGIRADQSQRPLAGFVEALLAFRLAGQDDACGFRGNTNLTATCEVDNHGAFRRIAQRERGG